jgi:hypothetical protein
MSEYTIVALPTYGREVLPIPGKRRESTLKIGTTNNLMPRIIEAIFGKNCQLIKSGTSYKYYALSKFIPLHQNWLVLKLTDEELKRVENITRTTTLARVANVYRDGGWWLMPNQAITEYRLNNENYSRPRFTPGGPIAIPSKWDADPALGHGVGEIPCHFEVTQEGRYTWISGDTKPHKEFFKGQGCRWSKQRTAWYYPSLTLPPLLNEFLKNATEMDAKQQEQHTQVRSEPPAATPGDETPAEPTDPEPHPEPQPEPAPEPQRVIEATATRIMKPTSTRIALPTKTYTIPQEYLGMITGGTGAECYAFGAAIHGNNVVYLDMAGSQTAIESVWAKLALGHAVKIIDIEKKDEGILLQPSGKALFKRFQQRIIVGFEHCVLVPKATIAPVYNERSWTYLIHVDDANSVALLAQHVNALVKIPVFDNYHTYLWERGRHDGLVVECKCYGGVKVFAVLLDVDKWTQAIASGLEMRTIMFPSEHSQ